MRLRSYVGLVILSLGYSWIAVELLWGNPPEYQMAYMVGLTAFGSVLMVLLYAMECSVRMEPVE